MGLGARVEIDYKSTARTLSGWLSTPPCPTMPPPANHPAFHLQVLQQAFDVQQYPCDCDISEVLERLRSPLNRAGLLSLTRTAEEVSIIQEACEGEGRWKCIKILGPMDFGHYHDGL